MLYTPLQSAVTLEELKHASENDPALLTQRTYIMSGWPSCVPEQLMPFLKVRDELSCWGKTCISQGLCTVVPRALTMAHKGHLGIVKLKQRCQDRVWWPGIDCNT